MGKMIFVNLPVKDLKKSMAFFSKLGFKFNPQFTNDNAACMIIEENNSYAMLLVEKFFKGFLRGKEISDAKKTTEVLVSLSLGSREEVDMFVKAALSAGGKEARETQDYGWMYGRAIEDLDGHIWEVGYMDMSKMPAEMKAKG
ncbi:MAG TPA: VOC family protein [Candidatus Bilamarchaeum sp.]|nr:VOC family protein [Candidatus Bilamarchaeum sp.]